MLCPCENISFVHMQSIICYYPSGVSYSEVGLVFCSVVIKYPPHYYAHGTCMCLQHRFKSL